MSDTSAAAAPTPNAAPYMWCSDCRAQMRERYYALNERPICATCRPGYAEKIERTDGKGAMWRIGLRGAAVAGIGAAVLAVVTSAIVPLSIVFFVPIGYFMGKRMMRALDGYSARRYQYLAVSLTYISFLVGMGAPSVIRARREYASGAATQAETRAMMAGAKTPTQEDLEIPAPAATDLEPTTGEAEEVDSEPSDDANASEGVKGSEDEKAAVPEPPDFGPGPGLAFAMFLLLPIVAQLEFGIGLASTAMLSILVALYQAWTRTDGQGMHLKLRGPYRVGQGPIPAR